MLYRSTNGREEKEGGGKVRFISTTIITTQNEESSFAEGRVGKKQVVFSAGSGKEGRKEREKKSLTFLAKFSLVKKGGISRLYYSQMTSSGKGKNRQLHHISALCGEERGRGEALLIHIDRVLEKKARQGSASSLAGRRRRKKKERMRHYTSITGEEKKEKRKEASFLRHPCIKRGRAMPTIYLKEKKKRKNLTTLGPAA